MKTSSMIAIGAIALAAAIFVNTSFADDHKNANASAIFDRGCKGTSAKVDGSEARLPWDGSDHVTIAVPAGANWRRGEGSDLVIRGDASDLARIRLDKGTIRLCGDDDLEDKVKITLPGVTFRSVTIAGAGEVRMEDVDQSALDLTIAGAGDIKAHGKSDEIKLTIAGAGDAHLGDLATKRLGVTITGAGRAEASPKDDADITIMGAGKVDLLTRPARHDVDVFGAGKVSMPDRT
jgi:hypothetical protein